MHTHQFSSASLIKQAVFDYAADRPPIAVLSAAVDSTPEQLSTIREAMEKSGWHCVPVSVGGRSALQVMGFKTEEEFLAALATQGFTAGAAETSGTKETEKTGKRSGLQKFLQLYSLQLAGVFNLIGDVGFLGNGFKTSDKSKIIGGGLYTLGGTNIALFGAVKPQENVKEISEDLADIIKHKTGQLPEGSGLAQVEVHKGKDDGPTLDRFLYRNAAQNTLGAYTLGAGAMLASGIRKHQKGEGSAGLYYGISSVVFKFASLLIPEKKANESPGNNKNKLVKRNGIIEWIREKPLRLFGYGSLVTDSLLALDTYQQFKLNPQKSGYMWTGVTAVTYILADLMMAISSKDPTNTGDKFDAEEQRRIEALAAESIAREPRQTQDELIQQVAKFLASSAEMSGDAESIGVSIRKQVTDMDHNPWASRVGTGAVLSPAR